jgi:Flp pilus assembly protein TadG
MSWRCNVDRGKALVGSLRQRARCFGRNDAGGTVTIFALTLPALVAAGAAAVDYSLAASTRSKMQAAADSAALSAVRELQLARTDASRSNAVATNVVNATVPGAQSTVTVDLVAMTVQVVVEKQYTPYVLLTSATLLHVSAKAKMSGSMPLCLLGLNPSAPGTINLDQLALLTAPACLVQSNSTDKKGLESKNSAVLLAGMVCSAGGKTQTRNANFVPPPTTGCPVLQDPLSARTPPAIGACNATKKVVDGLTVTLPAGVYCGGLKLTNGAVVTLSSGIFIIKDGPLVVDSGASISGTDVSFYLSGNTANITFDSNTTVNLAAPKSGALAGLLIYDDPSGAPAPALPPKSGRGAAGRSNKTGAPRQHQFLSDNARNLLGTIYMPKGEIIIDALKPIADKSAYTVLVVNQIHLYSGPNLILNTDYSATSVPVPMGVGPFAAKIFLSN